jgi:tRNA(Ile)-lysidine synthase
MRFGVAVSGGPDSLALLLLAQACRPGLVEAATVDHGLRPESAAEAAMVAATCVELGIAHRTLTVDVAGGNLQDAARTARYTALGQWAAERGLTTVVTAHHADDQAETVLMRLNRASGIHGLAGIRASRWVPTTGTQIIRPLLAWRKAELEAIVAAAGIAPAVDPSNRDLRFDRAQLRERLAAADWLDTAAIARSASHLADAEFALNWAIGREWDENVREEGGGFCYSPVEAPDAIRRGVLRLMIASCGGSEVRGGELATLEMRLRPGGKATLGRCILLCRRGRWTVTPEPGRR